MSLGLKLLGIHHQRTQVASPWQNGRIERFFGTFKAKVKQLALLNPDNLQTELTIFQVWYNQIRPHQNLNGLTPAEAFQGKPRRDPEKATWVSAWNGLLCGFYFPD